MEKPKDKKNVSKHKKAHNKFVSDIKDDLREAYDFMREMYIQTGCSKYAPTGLREEDDTFVCEKCGHICKKDTGKIIKTLYGERTYCELCKPAYDKVEEWMFGSDYYYKEVECDRYGRVLNWLERLLRF
jgi:hypothetical protein